MDMRRLAELFRGRLRRAAGRSNGSTATRLDWLDANEQQGVVRFGDVRLHVCLQDAVADKPSSPTEFVLIKVPAMVEMMADLADTIQPKNVFEIGIFRGGSVVLYNEMYKPHKLVSIDRHTTPLPQLEEYIRAKSAGSNVRIELGVNQADRGRLAEICQREFGTQPLDLVVDDASHLLFETREAFRELFPRLRPGGVYVIEDWGWAHWRGDLWQKPYFRGKESMTNLVMELVVLSASKPEWVSEVSVGHSIVFVQRGVGAIEAGFDPAAYCLNRGNPLPRF
jgi:predicted O-methyltransferase YrrM